MTYDNFFLVMRRLVLENPLSFFYVLPGVPMNIGLRPIWNDEQLNDFAQALFKNDFHLDMYTEHQGYDVLEMINDDRHYEDKSDSDFKDVKKGDNLDDVKDIVDFQTEGEENVDIPKLSLDDPWLNKLVGKGRFVGEMEDPIPGLKGRYVSACKCAGKRGKKQVQINDSLDKDKGKDAGGSPNKGKGKLGKDRSEPSKVSQATKERWRKRKLEEKENLKNAVDCPFRLWASWMSTEKSFQIKTLYPDHKCCRNYNLGSLVTYRWIAEHYAREIIDNPWVSYNYMQNSIRSKFMINVSLRQCKRAKQAALFDHEGGLIDHYSKIWQYRQAILDSNPGSTCHIDLEEKDNGLTYFKRIYVCFFGLKAGWLQGCRKVIAASSINEQFLEVIKEIKALDENAYTWLVDHDPKTWCRAYFEVDRSCAAFENGISDSFNSKILSARGKPIITMLEDIRVYIMQRVWFLNKTAMELNDSITPFARRHLEFMKIRQRKWVVYASGFQEVEVRRQDEAFGVNIHLKKCACNMWELTGLPCVHAVAGYIHLKKDPELGEHAEIMDKEAFADMVKKDVENKAKEAEMWRETYEEEKYWEEYASEFK
nr:calcium/proton exchanger [Tanacetum cinerariifolium]